jgi:carboxymethylenebutenolidase
MHASDISIDGPELGAVPAYEARPDSPRSAVVLLHEDFGLDEYAREAARILAVDGYHVVCPNLFHRTGGDVFPYGRPEVTNAAVDAVVDDAALDDVSSCLEHLHGHAWTPEQIGIVGYGIGGRYAFLAATAPEPRVATGISVCPSGLTAGSPPAGSLPLVSFVGRLRAPWLGVFGLSDPRTPPADIAQLERAIDDAKLDVHTQIVRYQRADRGFFSDRRTTYSHEAADDAWQRVLEWLGRQVAPRPTELHAAWLLRSRRAPSSLRG